MLFAGFFVKLETMSSYMYWMSYGSYMRYALDAILIAIYGAGGGKPRDLLDCIDDFGRRSFAKIVRANNSKKRIMD